MRLNKYHVRLGLNKDLVAKLSEILYGHSFDVFEKDGEYYWYIPELDAEPDPTKRYAIGHKEIEKLNAVLKIFSGNPDYEEDAKLLSVVRFHQNGQDIVIEPEPITAHGNLQSASATASGIGTVGSAPKKIAEDLLTVLSLDPKALEIANLINNKELKTFEFWKAKEIMVGPNGDLNSHGYLTKEENDQFKKWSNNSNASGTQARHYHPDPNQDTIPNISTETARQFILKAFRNWLKKKYNQDII
jgi:hypothetical protein